MTGKSKSITAVRIILVTTLITITTIGCRSTSPAAKPGYRKVTVYPIEGLWESELGSRIRFDRPAKGIYVGRLVALGERERKRGFEEDEIVFSMRFVKPYIYEGTALTKTQPSRRKKIYSTRITVSRDLYSIQTRGSGESGAATTTWQRVGRPEGRPKG